MFMSRSTQCMLTCPCGEVFNSSIYEYVNVAKDPQLQYTVLAGLLNVSTCPSCNRRAAIARPLIYYDEPLEAVERVCTNNQYAAHLEPASDLPPLQVVFGLDQLGELINVSLNQDERLGKLALSTHSRNDAERGRMLDIARKLASTMECQIEVEDMPGEYTIWLYGSRRQIGAIMRELAIHG